jgi:hypothetical protein
MPGKTNSFRPELRTTFTIGPFGKFPPMPTPVPVTREPTISAIKTEAGYIQIGNGSPFHRMAMSISHIELPVPMKKKDIGYQLRYTLFGSQIITPTFLHDSVNTVFGDLFQSRVRTRLEDLGMYLRDQNDLTVQLIELNGESDELIATSTVPIHSIPLADRSQYHLFGVWQGKRGEDLPGGITLNWFIELEPPEHQPSLTGIH